MKAAEQVAARATTDWSRVSLGVSIGAFSAYQQFKLPPILPDFLARYPHSPVVAAGFMSVYALVGLLVSGPIGRRLDAALGRFLIALFVLTVTGITLALVAPQSGPLMLASRALEGMAFAIGAIAGPAIAGAASRPRDLPLVTGLLAGWIPIGQIAAALMALAFGTWRPLWLVGLALSLPLGLWAWLLLRERGAGARVGRSTAPQPNAGQRRQLTLAGAIFLLWSAQYFAFMTWLTQYLSDALALNRQTSVLAYLLPVVVLLVFNVLTGWGLRRGMKLLPAMLAALLLQALVWFAQPWLRGDFGLAGLVAYGIGAGVTPTCLFHLPHLIARGTAGAASFGILMTGRNIGVFLGPILLAVLIGSDVYGLDLGWSGGARAMAGVTLAAALVVLALWRERRVA